MPVYERILPACADDSEAVYALLVETFRTSYLNFSVYQAPQSRHYLRKQIAESTAHGRPQFFVMWGKNRRLVGFYNAEVLGEDFFLKYIATDPRNANRGIGTLLLRHLEATAADFGCRRTGLAVFESNQVAVPWYGRRGYEITGREMFLRFDLEDLVESDAATLEWEPEDMAAALEIECGLGFSSLATNLGGVSIRIGLIAGEVCNVLDPAGEDLSRVAAAVAVRFLDRRRWLLMRSRDGDTMPVAEPETLERSLLMVRNLV